MALDRWSRALATYNNSLLIIATLLFAYLVDDSTAQSSPGTLKSVNIAFNRTGCARGVSWLSDVDGDFVDDYLIGCPGAEAGRGVVLLMLSANNATITIGQNYAGFSGSLSSNGRFGFAVTGAGDIDGDCVQDVVVSAKAADEVWVLYMLPNGAGVKNQTRIKGPPGSEFGSCVTGIGDLDGDEIPDIVVGANVWHVQEGYSGSVFTLFLNRNGTVKHQQILDNSAGNLSVHLPFGVRFGHSCDALHGAFGATVAVGLEGDDDGGVNRGALYLITLDSLGMCTAARKISNLPGLNDFDTFGGSSICLLDDLDGDGVPEIGSGAFGTDIGGSNAGAFWVVLMTAGGARKGQVQIANPALGGVLRANDMFGFACSGVRLNGKVHAAVGAPGAGSVFLLGLHSLSNLTGWMNPGPATGPLVVIRVTLNDNCSLSTNNSSLIAQLAFDLRISRSRVVLRAVSCTDAGNTLVDVEITGCDSGLTLAVPRQPSSLTTGNWTIISWVEPRLTTTSADPTATTHSSTESVVSKSGSSVSVVVGVAGGLIGCAAFLACAGVLVWQKRVYRAITRNRWHEEVPLSALQRSSTQRLTAVKLLGSGNFGAVYEGRVDGTNKRIAIKEVRSGEADEMQREAAMLMKCQHEFVVQFLGVLGSDAIAVAPGCPALGRAGGSVCMLTELCEYGSLEDALRMAKLDSLGVAVLSLETVSASWLLLVFWQVAEAMRFLTCEAKVLHRDLAARNVLLARASDGYVSGLSDSDGLGICARVSDFGLSESMYADFYDKQQGGAEALPLRWTAPEALLKHKFSEKSDVYSFGVLMVETLNMGALPLSQLLNSEVVASVQDAVQQSSLYLAAFNFDKPVPFVAAGTQEPLDEGVWAFVLRCVSVRAENRPSFSECSHDLKRYLQAASTAVFVPPPRQAVSVAGLLRAADEAKYGYPVTAGLTGDSSAAYAGDPRVGVECARGLEGAPDSGYGTVA